MPPITTYTQLEDFGRIRLSRNFFMRDFLHSEIAVWHGLRNVPVNPDLAVRNGRMLCEQLLEPLQTTFGRIHIRSGYRSPEVNDLGNRNNLNCASNEKNCARHIWDQPDANGQHGAMACIVVPWLVDYMQKGSSWTAMAWWIHDHLPYASLYFFAKLGAFNIGWHEAPERRIDSYAPPKGCLTRPGMANHGGTHASEYPGFPQLVRPAARSTGVSAVNAAPALPAAPATSIAEPTTPRAVAAPMAATPTTRTPAFTPPAFARNQPTMTTTFPASNAGPIRYRAIHEKTLWRKAGGHASLDSAIHGANGAAALFRGKVRIDYATHGQPRYAVVWQEGQGTGYVIKPDASQPQDIRVQSVPVQKLQAFEVAGQASAAQLEALFQP